MKESNLSAMAADYRIALTAGMEEQFAQYARLLAEWNEKINLTAITQPEEVTLKHFLDSLTLLWAADVPSGARLIDVGTGAGFPGIPVKIAREDIRLTLLDSLNKRINFLWEVSGALGQENELVHGRAEELGRKPEMREQFDVATARAVAALPALCEYCLPFVKVGGYFVAMKGGAVEEESEQSKRAIKEMGGRLEEIKQFSLPNGDMRSIVLVRKISQTPTKYPRASVKITKAPLV